LVTFTSYMLHPCLSGLRVCKFRVEGLGFRVWGSGSGFRVQDVVSVLRVEKVELVHVAPVLVWDQGLRFRI